MVYYIVPKNIAEVAGHHATSYHWHELPDGTALLSAQFSGESAQENFERHATVEPLPDIYDPTPLNEAQVTRFAYIGVKTGHTMKHLKAFAKSKLHRLL